MGLISLNLAFFNVLPIPGLDGGAILMLFVDQMLHLVGWSLSEGVRELILRFGFALLAGVTCVAIVLDVIKLF